METTFYVADIPEPGILGFPSCSRLVIAHLNCSIQFRKHGKPSKTCPEIEKVQQDMKKLGPINPWENLIKAYLNCFLGIGKFLDIYYIHLKEDVIHVIHTPRKCPIAI